MTPSTNIGESTERKARDFILQVARQLQVYGTPAHRLERLLHGVAGRMGEEASFFVTPTSVFVSFAGEPDVETHMLRADAGEVNLGKLVDLDELLEDLEDGRASLEESSRRVAEVADAPPRWSAPATAAAFGFASSCAACFFGGGALEIGVTFGLGLLIFVLCRFFTRNPDGPGLFEPTAAFFAALVALSFSRWVRPIDDRIVTLASLIVLIPGLTLTVGLIELATRHLVSGTARLAGAASTFFTILLGVALAWRLGSLWFPGERLVASSQPLVGAEWAALLIAPFAFAVLLEARASELWIIALVSIAGYLAARFGFATLGSDLGVFLGAMVVGGASNLYARLLDRPSSVPVTPGILLLVPGSLGYRSLTSFLDREAVAGTEWAFQTGLVAISLVGGLLAANVLIPPRRVL